MNFIESINARYLMAKTYLKKLQPRNKFARGVSILIGGTAVGQLIVLVASPILTRVYSPEDFGLLAIYAGLLGVVGVIASLCYELAIPLAGRDEEAASIVVLCVSIALIITLIAAMVVGLWADSISVFLNAPRLASYLWLLPVGIFFLGSYQALNYWAIRENLFSVVAKTKFTQSLSMIAVQIGGYSLGPFALILGQILGQAAGIFTLIKFTIRPKQDVFYHIRMLNLREVSKRWYKFPLYSSWSGIFNTASVQIPLLLFAVLFGPAIAGIYMLAQRVLDAPMRVVGQAISNVFFVNSAEALRDGNLAVLVASIHNRLAHFAMPPALVLMLAGPDLFGMAFGPEWRQAGVFAQWMVPWVYTAFITSPLSQLFFVLEKQAECMVLQGILLVTRVACLIIGASVGDALFTVGLFSIGSVICYIGFLIWIIYASGNSLRTLFFANLQAFLISTALVSPLVLFNKLYEYNHNWMIGLSMAMIFILMRYIFLFKKS